MTRITLHVDEDLAKRLRQAAGDTQDVEDYLIQLAEDATGAACHARLRRLIAEGDASPSGPLPADWFETQKAALAAKASRERGGS